MKHTKETLKMAQDVLDFITFNPHIHNQDNWSYTAYGETPVVSEDQNICNTSMCIAGTVQFIDKGIDGLRMFETDEYMAQYGAAELLGLDYEEADSLFYTFDNEKSIEMLRAVANNDEDKFWAAHESPKKSENADW